MRPRSKIRTYLHNGLVGFGKAILLVTLGPQLGGWALLLARLFGGRAKNPSAA